MTRIVVDAMGSDNYPAPDVEGAVLAAREYGVEIILTGDASKIQPILDSAGGKGLPIRVVHAPEMLTTLYLCWLEVLEHSAGKERATATVKEEQGTLTFEFAGTGGGTAGFEGLRDRVEALGGRLTFEPDAEGVTYVSGSLPVSG